MHLSADASDRFGKLYFSLLAYCNKRRKIIPDVSSVEDLLRLSLADLTSIRDELFACPSLLDDFIRRELTDDAAIEAVEPWRRFIFDYFLVLEHGKEHSIFLRFTDKNEQRAYGVVGMNDPLGALLPDLPAAVQTTLLSFEGKIVCDGLIRRFPIKVRGSAPRGPFDADLAQARARFGLITSLD